jgi:hemolysin activation/secretion protein
MALLLFLTVGALAGTAQAQPPAPPEGGATVGGLSATPTTSPALAPRPPETLFAIPPLRDRPLGTDEGDRLLVRRFVLSGAVDRPEYGIYLKDVNALVERLRLARQKMERGDIAGFTKEELETGAEALRTMVEQPEGVTKEEALQIVQQAAETLRQDREARSLTIGRIQEIADEVARYYREHGLILAQAFLPAQTVINGEVVIQVAEGTLGDVKVRNNRIYRANLLVEPFAPLVGGPVDKTQIESGLLQVSDYPGVAVFGVFQPGTEVGSTELVLNVQDEKRVDASIRADNYGSELTGEYRAVAHVAVNNPTQARDRFDLTAFQTFHPANGLYGSAQYDRTVFGPRNKVSVGYSRNTFELGQSLASLNLKGTTSEWDLRYERSLVRQREKNAYGRLQLARKSARMKDPLNTKDELAVGSLEFGFDAFDQRFAGVNAGMLRVEHGFPGALGAMGSNDPESSRSSGSGEHAGGDFTLVAARLDRMQTITEGNSLLLSIRGQYTNDLLVPMEQQALGGPGSVRAYPVSEYLRDKGYDGGVEWFIRPTGKLGNKTLLGRRVRDSVSLSFFADVGGGWLNDPLSTDQRYVILSGWGGGLLLSLGPVTAQVEVATPITSRDPSNGRDPQVFFRLEYTL